MEHLTGLGPTVIVVMWIQTLLATFFVVLRLYTRVYLVGTTAWDDYLMVASLVLFYGYTIFCTIAAYYGLGSHFADLTIAQFVQSNKMEIAGQTCNIFAIATSKSSVAFFLLRLVIVPWHKAFLWLCIFSTVVVCITCATLDFLQSTPFAAVFDPTIPHTVNFDFTANAIFSGGYTAFMDIVLAVFPWYFLSQVQIRRQERLTISISLSLGIFAGIFGIIRAVELSALNARSDYTYDTVPLILWGSSELLVTIGCACISVFRPLYNKVRGRLTSNDDSNHLSRGTRSKGQSYVLSSVRQDNYKDQSGCRYTAQVETDRFEGGGFEADNASDKSILREAYRLGIKETKHVTVSYDARSAKNMPIADTSNHV